MNITQDRYDGKCHLNGEEKPGWSDDTSDHWRFRFTSTWKFVDYNNGERSVHEFRERNKFKNKEEENFTTDYFLIEVLNS